MANVPSKENNPDDIIIVVSGLPRSGTSMMMKMLDACKMPLLIDNIRKADEDNPKGYYEFEKVKDLEKDNSWLDLARGKVVKIVSPLLRYLNMDNKFRYRIIFMLRSIDEILASQKKMAVRLQQKEDNIDDNILRQNYSVHLEEVKKWMGQQENIEVLYVNYSDAIEAPVAVAESIGNFLGMKLNMQDMTKVVDSALYRNRAQQSDETAQLAAPEESEDPEIIKARLRDLGYL
ncbi:MAG: sulfotransferase domain-containing protein [Nitrospirae bacterium]|nr:sulfotransferase domain-containing protein [Nitrospirota bacterium]